MLGRFTLSQFINYCEKFHKPYTIIFLKNGRTCVRKDDWYYIFDSNDTLWYKRPVGEEIIYGM